MQNAAARVQATEVAHYTQETLSSEHRSTVSTVQRRRQCRGAAVVTRSKRFERLEVRTGVRPRRATRWAVPAQAVMLSATMGSWILTPIIRTEPLPTAFGDDGAVDVADGLPVSSSCGAASTSGSKGASMPSSLPPAEPSGFTLESNCTANQNSALEC
jgi:hypothetical protein